MLYQQSQYDSHNQIVSVRMLIEELDLHDVVCRRMYRDYQLRYCHRWEVHHMLRLCGYEIEALYGDFDPVRLRRVQHRDDLGSPQTLGWSVCHRPSWLSVSRALSTTHPESVPAVTKRQPSSIHRCAS